MIFVVQVQNKSVLSATYLCAIVIPKWSKIQSHVKNDIWDKSLFLKFFFKNILFINDWDKPNLCIYNKYEQKNLFVSMSTKIVIQYIF